MFEFLDPIFNPLLSLNPLISIILISLLITLIVTIIHKYTTNQKALRALKEELDGYNREMRAAKNDTKKLMEIQAKAMEKNLEFMKHSFKSMLFTFIPIIIIFGWLNGHFAYEPIRPNQEFEIIATFEPSAVGNNVTLKILPNEAPLPTILNNETQTIQTLGIKKTFGTDWVGIAKWKLKGTGGNFVIEIEYDGKKYHKEVLITDKREYENPILNIKNSQIKSIKVNNEPMKYFGLSWIWIYIISSLIFSMILRKLMNVV